MTDEELHELEGVASPGAGACGGQFTANTMAWPSRRWGSRRRLGDGAGRGRDARPTVADEVGELVMDVLAEGMRPSDVITRESLENAIAAVAACGGSTNARPAPARGRARGGRRARHRRLRARSLERTPLLCDLKPGGRFVATDLYARRRRAARAQAPAPRPGLLHEDAITVTGQTIGEDAATAQRDRRARRSCARSTDPLKPHGGLAILRGNLAPEAAWSSSPATSAAGTTGPARVFESEEAAMAAVTAGEIEPGDVVVIRNEGPAGGPGMREMLAVTAAIVGEGLGDERRAAHRRPLLRRHPRLHGRPRRPRGRPAAARSPRSRDGDEITIDVDARRLDVALADDGDRRARRGLRGRRSAVDATGVLAKYAKLVSSAAEGAVTALDAPRRSRRPGSSGRRGTSQQRVEARRALEHRARGRCPRRRPRASRGSRSPKRVGVAHRHQPVVRAPDDQRRAADLRPGGPRWGSR